MSEDLATRRVDIDRSEDLVTWRKRISIGLKTWRRGKRISVGQKSKLWEKEDIDRAEDQATMKWDIDWSDGLAMRERGYRQV